MKKIIMLLGYDNFFGQNLYPWQSLDINYIKKFFLKNKLPIETILFHDIINKNLTVSNSIIIYSSSQIPEYKNYIEDCLIYLNSFSNYLIPSFDLFKCHDNKGFQELFKKKLKIDSINCLYLGSPNELQYYDLSFPLVYKYADGASGQNVFLVNTIKDINNLNRKRLIISLIKRTKILTKKLLKSYNRELENYRIIQKSNRFLLQKFIKNLNYDYKILIFFDKYFVLKRYMKKNDFRASGSGLFNYEDVDNSLLDYAKKLYTLIDSPFLSLDLCNDGCNYYLIEFQALHFGPYTVQNSSGYYFYENNNWRFIEQKTKLEDVFCESIIKYLKIKHLINDDY